MKRVLFIRYKKSNGIIDGGEQVAGMHSLALSQLVGEDHVVTYYIHNDDKKRKLSDYFFGIIFLPFNFFFGLTPKKVRGICKTAQAFDVVFIDRSVFGIIAKKLKETNYKGEIITFFHNAEAKYFDAKLSKRLPFRDTVIRCVDRNDAYSFQYSHKTIVLNRRDGNYLAERFGKQPDMVIPIVFHDKFIGQPREELTRKKPECLFIGSYFGPNNEGIVWFAKNILPHVDITMKVVGKGMDRLKKEEDVLRDIEVIGSAPDLAPYINEADLMILPVFKGSGMKVKTCESLMYGKNVIGTDEAFEGYEGDFERIGGKCNTAEEYIRAIQGFIDQPRPRFNTYSRNLFLEKYSEATLINSMRKVLFED